MSDKPGSGGEEPPFRPGGGKKRKIKPSPRRPVKKKARGFLPWVLAGGGLLALFFCTALYFFSHYRPIWYVDEEFFSDWGRILRTSSPPFTKMRIWQRGKTLPPGNGYIISPYPPGFEGSETGVPVQVYPDLSRTREWEGAQVLAVNPWMVFRKHQDPEPERDRVDSLAGGEGILLLPGADGEAVWAWLSQLLQERPGIFPGDPGVWQEARDALFQGRRFQQGAATYNWVDMWPVLNRRDVVWLYAPLSRIRELSAYRMGVLDATRFPERKEWNIYGVQADILWALPVGTEKQIARLDKARRWLRSDRTQTIIANTISWIPAHPQGTPYNTVSWESQEAWINSSFVWQGAAHERRSSEKNE